MNMIDEIYNISIQEVEPTEEELRLGKVINNLHEELKAALPEEQHDNLFALSDLRTNREALTVAESYKRGFKDAMRLVVSVH